MPTLDSERQDQKFQILLERMDKENKLRQVMEDERNAAIGDFGSVVTKEFSEGLLNQGKRLGDVLKNNVTDITAIASGVISQSPVVLILVKAIGDLFKARQEQKQEAIQARKDLSTDRASLERELQEQTDKLDLFENSFQTGFEEPLENIQEVQSAGFAEATGLLREISRFSEFSAEMLAVIAGQEDQFLRFLEKQSDSGPSLEDEREKAILEETRQDELLAALSDLKGTEKDDKEDSTGFLDKLKGFLLGGAAGGLLGAGILSSLKNVFVKGGAFFLGFSKKILGFLGRAFLPVLIVTGLINAVLEGWETWIETGSIQESLLGALGGVVEVVSFGFIDPDDIRGLGRKLFSAIETGWNEMIEIVNMFDFSGLALKIFDSISGKIGNQLQRIDNLTGISDKFDSAMDSLQEVFSDISEFFDKIINFDFSKFIKESLVSLPGGVTVGKLFGFEFDSNQQKAAGLQDEIRKLEESIARDKEFRKGPLSPEGFESAGRENIFGETTREDLLNQKKEDLNVLLNGSPGTFQIPIGNDRISLGISKQILSLARANQIQNRELQAALGSQAPSGGTTLNSTISSPVAIQENNTFSQSGDSIHDVVYLKTVHPLALV